MGSLRLPPRIRQRQRPAARTCQAHRAWVRRHHCCVPHCRSARIECAHVRVGTNGGVGLKPSDRWIISLCADHHAEQHLVGEREFERRYGLELLALAEEFARRSPHRAELQMLTS